MGAEGDRVETRLARGCRCFAACAEGRVAGYGWLSTGREWIGEVGLELRPGPGEAYVWNCLTLPGDRRRGVFGSVLHRIVATASAERLQRLWIASVAGGATSVVTAAGFAPVLIVDTDAAGPLRVVRAAPAPGARADDVAAARAALQVAGRFALRRNAMRRH